MMDSMFHYTQGKNCEQKVDDCVSTHCLNSGACSNVTNSNCTCSPGYPAKRCDSYATVTSTNDLLSITPSTSTPAQLSHSFTAAFSSASLLVGTSITTQEFLTSVSTSPTSLVVRPSSSRMREHYSTFSKSVSNTNTNTSGHTLNTTETTGSINGGRCIK